jgi:NAD(P)-dependent dehydrogenase (short-subunit alcohol dehydrogenase family)
VEVQVCALRGHWLCARSLGLEEEGIGRMIANALAENGAKKVYIIGRREDKLQAVAKHYPG